ncbi:MAG: hypothetical protein Tsb0013_04110 [Phycisphaerales bacterium]
MRTAPIVLAAVASSVVTLLGFQLITGASATARPVIAEGQIAICDVATLSEDMMDSDRYLPQRDAKRDELRTQFLAPLEEQAKALEEEFTAAQQAGDQDRMQQLQQQFFQLQQQGQEAQQQFQQELQSFIAQQFKDAYTKIVESAAAVGEDMGFSYVAASTPPMDEFEDQTFADLLTEVLSRTYVHYPEGVDITADVRDDLNLDASE